MTTYIVRYWYGDGYEVSEYGYFTIEFDGDHAVAKKHILENVKAFNANLKKFDDAKMASFNTWQQGTGTKEDFMPFLEKNAMPRCLVGKWPMDITDIVEWCNEDNITIMTSKEFITMLQNERFIG